MPNIVIWTWSLQPRLARICFWSAEGFNPCSTSGRLRSGSSTRNAMDGRPSERV